MANWVKVRDSRDRSGHFAGEQGVTAFAGHRGGTRSRSSITNRRTAAAFLRAVRICRDPLSEAHSFLLGGRCLTLILSSVTSTHMPPSRMTEMMPLPTIQTATATTLFTVLPPEPSRHPQRPQRCRPGQP